MIEFGGIIYYIDFKILDKFITVEDGLGKVKEIEIKTTEEDGKPVKTETWDRTSPQGKGIDAARYDLVKTFIEYLIDFESDADDTLGAERALDQTPLGFKIVFNTLLREGILKEKQN